MQELKIEKITLNVGVGGPGDPLEKAMKLLKSITGTKPVHTKTIKRIPTWGVRPNLEIGAKVTIRGKKAEEILSRLLKAKESKILETKFDQQGNFSFGIAEYIDIPGVEYIVEVGIIGLDVAVTLKRAGFRIKNRLLRQKKLPTKQKITKEEAMEFIKTKFNVEVTKRE